eukprot:scaffold4766_cov115-Isochrysis_galbana.AAC.7
MARRREEREQRQGHCAASQIGRPHGTAVRRLTDWEREKRLPFHQSTTVSPSDRHPKNSRAWPPRRWSACSAGY